MNREDEIAIKRGLLIKEYPSKWKQAKSAAIQADKDSYDEYTAFEYACRLFLQLGGKAEKSPACPIPTAEIFPVREIK